MPAYNNIILLLLLLLMSSSGEAVASPRSNWKSTSSLETRQSNPIATRYCNPATSICYLQYTWGPTIPVFRVAVPDSAVAGAPFDTLLQIVAPASLGWAGFAWGGRMTLNPLTVVWPNGNNVMVSSRWASAHSQPSLYSSATYRTLSASRNSTHWTVETVCSGCSSWNGASGRGSLSPSGSNTFAWAVSKTAVSRPASTSSSFGVHDDLGTFSDSLALGKVPAAVFNAYVKGGK